MPDTYIHKGSVEDDGLYRSWLIQRLEKPHGPLLGGRVKDNPFSFGGGLKNGGLGDNAMDILREAFSFDYMGAAEFEWGAVPSALSHIAQNQQHYVAYDYVFPLADVKPDWRDNSEPEGNATVYILCAKDELSAVAARIHGFACNQMEELKEWTRLSSTLRPATKYDGKVVGWLELHNGFMFFTDEEMWRSVAKIFGIEIVDTESASESATN